MVTTAEAFCLVIYDVPDDAIRTRFSETCLDYGLERFQMSAFWGYLSASRRKEVFVRLSELLGKAPGRILVQPIGSEDLERRYILHQNASLKTPGDGKSARKHRQFPEPGSDRPSIIKF